MESSPEEVAVTASYSSSSTGENGYAAAAGFTKRKRTKRLRAFPASPPPLLPPGDNIEEDSYFSTTTTTEEEEDMANCLILLAQGRTDDQLSQSPKGEEKFTSRKFTETITAAGAKAGFYVYECKTCNKCFPSFQALGGHRASHKKPKMTETETVTATTNIIDHGNLEISMNSFAKPSNILVPAGTNNKFRVHECSICGSEFASGQALGGHMRRHRPVGPPASEKEKEKKSSMLSLDLNLPAPSEETVAFAFSDQRQVVFASSAAALVDCHF